MKKKKEQFGYLMVALVISAIMAGIMAFSVSCADGKLTETTIAVDGKVYKVVEVVPDNKDKSTVKTAGLDDFPQNPTYGYKEPGPYMWYIKTVQGEEYVTPNDYVELNGGVIRINGYRVRYEFEGRWYPGDGWVELDGTGARIERGTIGEPKRETPTKLPKS